MVFKSLSRRWLTRLLCFCVGLGIFAFAVGAMPQGNFWRIVQIAERLSFLYGGVDGPAEYLTIENDGRVGIGTIPANTSAILELKSEDKALLVTRVDSVSGENNGNIRNPENGMIVYENANSCFKVYQSGEWSECLGTSSGIRVLPTEPTDGTIGDVYYNTTNNTLFIHNGDRFVAVTANFLELVAYNHSCTKHTLVNPSLQLRCPNNKQITSLFYETATFSNRTDNHSIPEIEAVECCETTYHPFYWHTTDWETCVNGTQSRTVTCRDVNDNVVDLANTPCITDHRPSPTQSCQSPVDPGPGNGGGGNGGGGGNDIAISCGVGENKPSDNDASWPYGPTLSPQAGYDGRNGISAPACLSECKDRIRDLVNAGETSTQFTCRRHAAGHCYPAVAGHDRQVRNFRGCNECQTRFCTVSGGNGGGSNPSNSGRWVSTNGLDGRSCSQVCSATGQVSAASREAGDPSGFICASGENHTVSTNPSNLGQNIFAHGCGDFSCDQNGLPAGSPHARGGINVISGGKSYCYGNGQKQDRDSTDLLTGCYCQ